MSTADTLAAVAHGYHDVQIRSAQFQSGRIGQGAAVQTMQGVGVKKGIEKARAADIADHGDLMAGQSHILKGLVEGVGDTLMGTPRAKYRRSRVVQQTIHV